MPLTAGCRWRSSQARHARQSAWRTWRAPERPRHVRCSVQPRLDRARTNSRHPAHLRLSQAKQRVGNSLLASHSLSHSLPCLALAFPGLSWVLAQGTGQRPTPGDEISNWPTMGPDPSHHPPPSVSDRLQPHRLVKGFITDSRSPLASFDFGLKSSLSNLVSTYTGRLLMSLLVRNSPHQSSNHRRRYNIVNVT